MPSEHSPNGKTPKESKVLADKLQWGGMALLYGAGLVRLRTPNHDAEGSIPFRSIFTTALLCLYRLNNAKL